MIAELRDVEVAYDRGQALGPVSLSVTAGESVALVGPSGGGKSTVLSLLPRFYDVTDGAVTVNGRDVRQLKTADLRDRIALVTQEPFLFDDTIAANIASQFREAYGLSVNVLIATGLVLFIITFAVNSLERWIIARRSEFSGAS